MSAEAMLSLTVDLNIQPGEIPPSIHLKQESDSLFILLRIAAENATLETGGTAIVKAVRPDKSDLFIVLPISNMDAKFISVELTAEQIRQMTTVAGKFEGTISIIDSENIISQADYEDYDLVTVQPFILDVEKSVGE